MKKLNRNLIILSALAATLSACTVGKKYSRTELNLPDQYRGQTQLTGDTVLLPWRTFFKDPTLTQLIEKALQRNAEVNAAVMTVQQLELNYKQARHALMPTLNLNAGANRTWLSSNSLNGSLSDQFLGTSYMDDYSVSLNLSWEADIWGKAKMQKAGALADYFAQKENLRALETRIISSVAQAYYNLIALDEQLRVAQRNVILGDSTLRIVQLQYQSAQVNALAVEQAVAQKKTAELLIPLAHQNIAVQENALSILCGNYPDSIARAGHFANIITSETFPAGPPALLLSRRPDVQAAEFAVMSANAKTGLAKAAMYPTFSITPSIGANSFKFNTWFNIPGSLIKTVGANLTQPLLQQRALRTRYKVAALEQEKAVTQFKQTVLTAVGEVSDALARTGYADERLNLAADKTKALNKATRHALLLYKSGMANYLEVLVAQNNALQNELEAIVIQREKLDAMTDLYRALGGGAEN
jgi:NodT family efflux transporter outer membrane factor (OMF) lipoprotein